MPLRLKHWVIPMPQCATQRPNQLTLRRTLKHLFMPIRPGQNQSAAKPCREWRRGTRLYDQPPRLLHGPQKVAPARTLGPISCVNPWRPTQNVNLNPRIVGQRRQSGCLRNMMRLEPRIPDKARFGLLRRIQTEVRCRLHRHPKRCQQRDKLINLPLVVRCKNQRAARESSPGHSPSAAFCAATRSAQPVFASANSDSMSSCEKLLPSADI